MQIRSVRGLLMFLVAVLALSASAFGQVRISVTFGPPALPVYEQPPCPGDGYIWTPGYWAWSDDDGDYFWVPGTWVEAPEAGFFWTPPYWAWVDGGFVFYDGYWGPQVGFYGGINYGFGYFGDGFVGGRWNDGHFFYNRAVTNVNVTNIHNVYNETVINNTTTVNRVSYNGGEGGVVARPTAQQEAAAHERHLPPAAAQVQQVQAARGNRELLASANHGKPPVAATAKPGDFSGHDVKPAKQAGAPYKRPAPAERARSNETAAQPSGTDGRGASPVHPNDLPPMDRPAAPNTGNAKLDKKYQEQQQTLQRKQDQELKKLQQRQDQEHQQLAQKKGSEAQKQQMEQRHQKETEQLQQKHQQQQQRLQQRQAPPPKPEKPR